MKETRIKVEPRRERERARKQLGRARGSRSIQMMMMMTTRRRDLDQEKMMRHQLKRERYRRTYETLFRGVNDASYIDVTSHIDSQERNKLVILLTRQVLLLELNRKPLKREDLSKTGT